MALLFSTAVTVDLSLDLGTVAHSHSSCIAPPPPRAADISMSRHNDPVLFARICALPVDLSPDLSAGGDVCSLTGMPMALVLEPRATTLFLSVFFDAGVQSSGPWLSVATMFGASPSAASTFCEYPGVQHPVLNPALMRVVCPSPVLRAKVLLAIFECALRRIDEVPSNMR